MATYHEGFKDIKVTLLSWEGDNFAKRVYEFGRLSHDFNYPLVENYNQYSDDCTKLITKIINGTTLPKFALMGTRIEFRIENISRICLAQLTRDNAIFASASTGVFPLTQDFNIPLSIYQDDEIMDKLKQAQDILEEAYIIACEKEIPSIEARYIGLHCQNISITASFTPSDFVRSCHSRTSSNFCDECNYIYRLMYRELTNHFKKLKDDNSIALWNWLLSEEKCINDGTYKREKLYNSDFTDWSYNPPELALNDWRKSGWKLELERMLKLGIGYLTKKEKLMILNWLDNDKELPSTYRSSNPNSCINAIKKMPYYKEISDV